MRSFQKCRCCLESAECSAIYWSCLGLLWLEGPYVTGYLACRLTTQIPGPHSWGSWGCLHDIESFRRVSCRRSSAPQLFPWGDPIVRLWTKCSQWCDAECTPDQNIQAESNYEETTDKPEERDWPVLFKIVKVMRDKKDWGRATDSKRRRRQDNWMQYIPVWSKTFFCYVGCYGTIDKNLNVAC